MYIINYIYKRKKTTCTQKHNHISLSTQDDSLQQKLLLIRESFK